MLDEIAAENLKFWPIISQGGTYTYNAVKVIAYYLRPFVKTNKLKKHGPFLWMGLNCLKATESLQRGTLLFITDYNINLEYKIDDTQSFPWVLKEQTPLISNGEYVLNDVKISVYKYTHGWDNFQCH